MLQINFEVVENASARCDSRVLNTEVIGSLESINMFACHAVSDLGFVDGAVKQR